MCAIPVAPPPLKTNPTVCCEKQLLVNDKLKRSIYRPFAFKFVLLYKRRYKRNDKQEILKDIEKAKTLTITLKTIFGLEVVLSEELDCFSQQTVGLVLSGIK